MYVEMFLWLNDCTTLIFTVWIVSCTLGTSGGLYCFCNTPTYTLGECKRGRCLNPVGATYKAEDDVVPACAAFKMPMYEDPVYSCVAMSRNSKHPACNAYFVRDKKYFVTKCWCAEDYCNLRLLDELKPEETNLVLQNDLPATETPAAILMSSLLPFRNNSIPDKDLTYLGTTPQAQELNETDDPTSTNSTFLPTPPPTTQSPTVTHRNNTAVAPRNFSEPETKTKHETSVIELSDSVTSAGEWGARVESFHFLYCIFIGFFAQELYCRFTQL